MAVVDAQGTAVTYEDNLSAAQTVGRILSYSGPGGSVDVKDRTVLANTIYKTKAPGLIDPGQVTIEVYHDLSDSGQAALYDAWETRATREMVLTLADSSTLTFQAFVGSVDGPVPNLSGDVTMTYTLEVSDAVVDA